MQKELLQDKHIDFIRKHYNLSKDEFVAACTERNEIFDKLFEDLMWKECDAAEELTEKGAYSDDSICAIELIDIMCGPYDVDEINREYPEDE